MQGSGFRVQGSGFRVDLVLQVRGLECVHPPAVRLDIDMHIDMYIDRKIYRKKDG